MFVIRDAALSDLDDLYQLATHLDTVNLPAERTVLADILELSAKSFGHQLPPMEREYLFVMEDTAKGRLVGTSMIIAQHGTTEAPHIFFEVTRDEKYSSTLNRHFVHQVLKLGFSYNGPTEIGGIVLDPAYRGSPERLGKQLSYVRFLYIARHPTRFRRRIIAELLPPLEADGTSLLWESLGRHFTGLSYQEADRISKTNKEFIRTLFPHESIYASLLPENVQDIIGEVGPETKGVAKMLEEIGFEYQRRIDPFDGGPHFSARVEDITLIQAHQEHTLGDPGDAGVMSLVARERDQAEGGRRFACVRTRCEVAGGYARISREALDALAAQQGEKVSVLPISSKAS
jgi:arginine N-succinyltransferase